MDFYNLTNPQKSIIYTEEYFKNTTVNNICGTLIIKEKVNFVKLAEAIKIFIESNDSFRLRLFLNEANEFVQYVSPNYDLDDTVVFLKSEEELCSLEEQMVSIPFSLIDSQLFEFRLFKFPNNFGGFVINTHHLISDACTESLIASKIITIYSALVQGEEPNIEPTSYLDYIKSEEDYISSSRFEKDKTYWESLFNNQYEIATIPYTKNSNTISCKAARKSFVIPNEKLQLINQFCSKYKVSVFNFFMAIYAIYIQKISNLDEFVIGTPILNRTNFVEKNTAGMFISTMPFKFSIKSDSTFVDFVKLIASDSLGMLRHQKYPYQNILEYIRKLNPSQPNLYNLLISYQNAKTNRNSSDIDYEVRWTFNHNVADPMQIHLSDTNDSGILNIDYDYRLDKYNQDSVVHLHSRICHIIEQLLSNEEIIISELSLVTPEEQNLLLNKFNDTYLKYDSKKTIIDYFEEQVEKTPNHIALVFDNKTLTYKQLNEKVNSLAHYLRKNGIRNNDIVGVMIERSFEMLISILAVLKSGGAYIPIDPDYPEERISYILENSKCPILITEHSLQEKIKKLEFNNDVIFSDLANNVIYNNNFHNPVKISEPNDLSYLIYTSGSTGKPKGVMLTHKNLSNFESSMLNTFEYLKDGKEHSIVSITTVSFDIFAFESIISLTKGLKIFITNPSEQKMTIKLEKLLLTNNVEIIQTTPSIMNFHLENSNMNGFSNLKYIVLAGEPLPKQLLEKIKKVIPGCTVYNGYGPSETTIFSAVKDVTNLDCITIGKPIHNTQFYILNDSLNLLPPGIPGEIYIAGDGVGRGYLNNNELTNERYLKNPFTEGTIMYKTGDVGIWLENGEVLCKGRVDNQVKLRGLRIELGEIESIINSFSPSSDIKSAVIIKKIDGRDTLNAFISSSSEIDVSKLEAYLLNYLPIYMLPNSFTILSQLPFTPNGKIDRKALLNYEIQSPKRAIMKEARTETQRIIFDAVSKIINHDNFGISTSFFEIGLDSLCIINLATILSKKFNKNITVSDIYKNSNIENLASLIESISTNENEIIYNIPKTDSKEFYNVSSAQKRVYYASKFAGENTTLYNMPGMLIFKQKPNIQKLNECFKNIITRHSSLRTHFEVIDGQVMQKISSDVCFEVKSKIENNKSIDEIVQSFVEPFDLSKAPLLRACLIEQTEQTMLLFDMHHIISDGLSLSILASELCKLYNGEKLPEISLQYVDYSEWEYESLKDGSLQESKDFWTKQFDKNIPVLNMPTDYPRPAVQSSNGSKIYKTISGELAQKIEELSKKLDVSNYVILLSSYYILLSKYTGQEDIIIGTPAIGRNREELSDVIGMFVNSLPLRNYISPSMSFYDFLKVINTNFAEALTHQLYPFDELVNNLNMTRDASRSPIFDSMFIYQNNAFKPILFDGIEAKYYIPDIKVSKFDLSLEVVPVNNNFNLNFEYCTSLFSKDTIERFASHFINILEAVTNNYKLKIKDIDILSGDERNTILYEFNNTKTDYPKNKTISNLFEEQVEKTPDNIAVIFEEQKLTYRELNEKANQLAHFLEKQGINSSSLVGIMLPRSLEVLVCMLGVLKIGACYIPIDPTLPSNRINYMLDNSKTNNLLTLNSLASEINVDTLFDVSLSNKDIYSGNTDNLNIYVEPESPSYMIYTSGSTGTPKGVVLKHKSLTNLATYLNSVVEFLKDEYSNIAIASITTISFDIFIFETLICLQRGLKVVMANEAQQNTPNLLDELIQKNNVKAIQMTPSRMSVFLENKNLMPHLKDLRYVVLAGEALPKDLLDSILELGDIKVYNGYGPSETTVFSTFTDVTNYEKITIGKPLANTRIYILDKDMNLCPVGIPGELYIAGDGVGLGYSNNIEMTKERFLPDCFVPNEIMYKTGDLAKELPNGEIHYIGRIDNQIKIRGLRIELGEIESCILKYPNIDKCVITANTDANHRQYITAYITVTDRISINKLRMFLSELLPKYMLPSYFMILSEFPYLNNGKIDKKALPKPEVNKIHTKKSNYVAPTNKLELQIASVFQSLLSISPIGIDDNFFELGGDSLLAINLQVELLKLNLSITYTDIFMHPTIRELARKISSHESSTFTSIDTTEFANFNKILDNTCNLPEQIVSKEIGNILITGATGFLGAHVLAQFLKNENGIAYCLIRSEPGLSSQNKLIKKLHFYFGEQYDKFIGNRIIIIDANISKYNFGLSDEKLKEISSNISCVINCAAMVSHYGNYNVYKEVNVDGVENLIKFCMQSDKRFYQISTLSVSGNSLVDQSYTEQAFEHDVIFKENNFYIEQALDNVYVRSKFEAEKIVLQNILKGLDAYILRVGNLMNRFSDGKFQSNVDENAYIARLVSLSNVGCIPDYLLNGYMEFTPIDVCADAIMNIVKHPTNENRIFHLYNHNHVDIKYFINIIKNYIPFEVVSNTQFINKVNDMFKQKNSNKLLAGILRDFNSEQKLVYESQVKLESEFTIEYLSKIGFKWPKIEEDYLIKFIDYYCSIGYLNKKEKN